MVEYNREDFLNTVREKGIKNGTKFMVKKGTVEIGEICIVDAEVINLMGNRYPQDIQINDEYTFVQIQEEN